MTITVRGAIFATVIVSEFVPVVGPSVHWPTEVGPLADVVGALIRLPPPWDTTTVTLTPDMTFPFWSLTTNVGLVASVAPAGPLVGGAVTSSTEVGTGAGAEESWHAYKVSTHVRTTNG